MVKWTSSLENEIQKEGEGGETISYADITILAGSYFSLGTVYLITLAQSRSSCGAVDHKSKTGKGVKCFYSDTQATVGED